MAGGVLAVLFTGRGKAQTACVGALVGWLVGWLGAYEQTHRHTRMD